MLPVTVPRGTPARPVNVRERTRTNATPFVRSLKWIAFYIFAFGLGMIFTIADNSWIKASMVTVQLSFEQLTMKSASGNWYPARFRRSGVLRYDMSRTQPGYTLYSLAPDLSAHLIDMDGRALHRWTLSRARILPNRTSDTLFGMLEPQIETGHLFPNGDLLLLYEQKAVGGAHTQLVKLDKNSNVVWNSPVNAHHAIEVVGDRIYALTGKIRPSSSNPIINAFRVPYLDESVSILDADGNTLSTYSILQAMANTKRMRLADAMPSSDRIDRLHSNSLDVLTEQTARFIRGAKPGDVLLSLRNLDMLVVMNLKTEKIVWALRGSWRQQHDAKMLQNGHILLFDNRGDLMDRGRSRVLEIDPGTGGIVWSYDGTESDLLDSHFRGGAQRLANGNTMISESTTGRIIEVAADGTIVWEYVSPLQAEENGHKLVASLGLNVTRLNRSALRILSDRARREVADDDLVRQTDGPTGGIMSRTDVVPGTSR